MSEVIQMRTVEDATRNPEHCFRLSSEVIPHGLALVSDKHRPVTGMVTHDRFELVKVTAYTKMGVIRSQFAEQPAANASILDFCYRNPAVILPFFDNKEVQILCAPATVFVVRGQVPERQLVLGLQLSKGEGHPLKYKRLNFDLAPPDGTRVLLLK